MDRGAELRKHMDPSNFSYAFGVWAAVVGIIGASIVWELTRLRGDLKELAENLNQYVLHMERRVTHIESHMELTHENFRAVRQE